MIKKFNEFIEEGFLSKTIGRAKSDEKRLEDKYDPKKICQDFLYALYDYAEENRDMWGLWYGLTVYLKINYDEYLDDNKEFPDWGIDDVLDKYTLDEFVDECYMFIEKQKQIFGNKFDYDRFKEILDKY